MAPPLAAPNTYIQQLEMTGGDGVGGFVGLGDERDTEPQLVGQVIEEPFAYALSRPPGHHASIDSAGGFCFLNNAAIAAQHLTSRFPRIVVLDPDMHHGIAGDAIDYHIGVARDFVVKGVSDSGVPLP